MAADVKRPKEHEEMLRELCQADGSVFDTYKDALVFAAALGFSQQRREKVGRSSEPVAIHIFHGKYDLPLINCIALAETGEPSILSGERESERIGHFEEYAAGGLGIIRAKVYAPYKEGQGDLDELILSLVQDQSRATSTILDEITDDIFSD